MTSLAVRGEQALERLGDRDALLYDGVWHRSGELAARGRRASAGFAGLGIRPGDRVVVVMANCPEVAVTYAALWRAGAVPTPVLFLLTAEELRHVVTDSGAVAVVTTPEFLATVRAAAPGLPVVVVGDDPAVTVVEDDPAVTVVGDDPAVTVVGDGGDVAFADLEGGAEGPLVDRSGDDLAALLYTGGTTGRSKGVALTHAGLDASGAAAGAAVDPPLLTSLLPLPMAHAYGLLVTVAGLHATEPSRAVLMRWFDPTGFCDLVQEHGVQGSALVPSMLQMLLALPLEDWDLSTLTRVSCGAAPLAREVVVELERRVPGLQVREGYGCTESSALISTQPAGNRRLGSVGKPVPGVEVRIEGPDGAVLGPDEDGEICVRGPVVMQGYWNSPEATAEAVRDGWFHTGDVGHLDAEGWLYVVDRLKDLIIRGGFNVYPRDVEDALLEHPEVVGAVVVGRPHPTLGEEVVAQVVLAPGATVDADAVLAWAATRLGAHKRPREVRVVDAVPLTAVGKLDRKAVRAALGDRP